MLSDDTERMLEAYVEYYEAAPRGDATRGELP